MRRIGEYGAVNPAVIGWVFLAAFVPFYLLVLLPALGGGVTGAFLGLIICVAIVYFINRLTNKD